MNGNEKDKFPLRELLVVIALAAVVVGSIVLAIMDSRLPPVPKDFDVWRPYGIDVRYGWKPEDVPLQFDGEHLSSHWGSYFAKPPIAPIAGCKLHYLNYAKESDRILGIWADIDGVPQNERDSRKLFRAYQKTIELQLQNEPRPKMDRFNEPVGELYDSWRIMRGEELYWFRLDWIREGEKFCIKYEVWNPSAMDDMWRKLEREKRGVTEGAH